jgi:hypothetical protein
MKIEKILLMLAILFFVSLMFYRNEAVQEAYADVEASNAGMVVKPDFIDASMLQFNVIPNAPAPAGTDQTEKLLYTAADLDANIQDVKKKYDLLNFNLPSFIKREVNQQVISICQRQPTTEYGPETSHVRY